MSNDRRTLISGMAGAALLAPFLALEKAMAQASESAADSAEDQAVSAHLRLMAVPGMNMHGHETVAMLLYPGFTALDLVGPHYFFASMMGAKVHLVTTQDDLSPVVSDLGLAIAPTMTLRDCPEDLTVVFVPGGTAGTLAAASDQKVLTFLRDRARRARAVTSVCTGSLVLGAAGLLKGRKATAHWVVRNTLDHFGATPVDQRVVIDGNLVTGAGVSAGLDFALAVVEILRGRPYAEALMLQAEYSPEPPFKGGTLASTDPAIGGPLRDMFSTLVARARALPVLSV